MRVRQHPWKEKNRSTEIHEDGSGYLNNRNIVGFWVASDCFIKKILHEYKQKKERKSIHKLNKLNREHEKRALDITDRYSFKSIDTVKEELLNATNELFETTRFILKNNSPVFKMPKMELLNENKLVDKTPIDPYHSWAIVPYAVK